MKTKKFIEKVKDLGYSIQLENHTQYKWADITIDDDDLMERDKQVARVSTGWEAWGTLYQMEFSGGNEIELLRVIAKYLETPLSEREEPKKYIYVLPANDMSSEDGNPFKIMKDMLGQEGKILLDASSMSYCLSKGIYHFTDAEVLQYPESVKQLFKVSKKVEVTKESES